MKKRIMSILSQRHDYYELDNTTKKLYNMETLKEKLGKLSLPWKKGKVNEKDMVYEQEGKSDDSLTKAFSELAPYFISGGYIKVREDYRVYPTTVEFYFHSEKEDGIKDPIVYHRDNNKVQGKIPFFPVMTLHAHDSGYDITFENPKEEYRASVLIRAYQIYDVHNRCWLNWTEDEQVPKDDPLRYKFISSHEGNINTQSTYLKYILNSFVIGGYNNIDWVDATTLLDTDKLKEPTKRQNVYSYEPNKPNQRWDDREDKRYEIPRQRKWSFSRENPIE